MEVIKALNSTGLGRFWDQQTGAAYRGSCLIRYGVKGGGDVSGILKGGYRVEIEIKTGKGKQRKTQEAFEKMIKAWGGVYFVARSVEEAINNIKLAATDRDR